MSMNPKCLSLLKKYDGNEESIETETGFMYDLHILLDKDGNEATKEEDVVSEKCIPKSVYISKNTPVSEVFKHYGLELVDIPKKKKQKKDK